MLNLRYRYTTYIEISIFYIYIYIHKYIYKIYYSLLKVLKSELRFNKRFIFCQQRQECECERHTCGESCDRCCPMYNQVPWKPGTSGKGFHCEKCNCNGHATTCRYDPDVAEEKSSMDIRGKYRGGGVCINCSVRLCQLYR